MRITPGMSAAVDKAYNNMQIKELGSLSVRELSDILRGEIATLDLAKKEFEQAKIQQTLNFKKVGIKTPSNLGQINLEDTDAAIKQQLIRKIMAARAAIVKVRTATRDLGRLSFSSFERAYMGDLTVSAAVQILRNLGASEEDIEQILLMIRGDENYDELREVYADYQINKYLEENENARIIPREEIERDFFGNGRQ